MIDDTSQWLKERQYKNANPKWFYGSAAVLVMTYGGLAAFGVDIPHGLDIVAGAIVGGQYARTFRPNGKE